MEYVLALDQGTTSTRAIVFDRRGRVSGQANRELLQLFPQPGWVEHDPAEIWTAQLETAREAMAAAGARASQIAGIGITNQRETTLLWERDSGVPIGNAIVWQDRRSSQICDDLRSRGVEPFLTERTGLVLDPYFSAPKINWLLDETPGLRARAERGQIAFGTIDTWLLWNLTGGAIHATDHTNASRTLLFNLSTMDWDADLLALFNVPRGLLPEIRPSIGSFGMTASSIFGSPVPVAAVAGDQQAALFGQAGFRTGLAKNTYGTGSFVMLNTGDRIVRSTHGMLSTIAYSSASTRNYALEGSIFVTGAAVQWLRDGLGIIHSSSEAEYLARQVTDNGGVYFVPAFAGLGAPYWDPYARGTIVGLTRGTTRAHIARAAIEAMAYQSADVLEAMQRDAYIPLHELRVDGGASVNDLMMQLQADLLGVDVVRPRTIETTALGVAFMAGLHAGFWGDLEQIEKLWHEDRRFTPNVDDAFRAEALTHWRRAVDRARNWAI